MNVPQRLPRHVIAAVIAAALIAPTAARPAPREPPSRGEPSSVAPVNQSAHTVVSPRPRRCGDLLVASQRPVALPSCPGGWHLDGWHQEHPGRDDRALVGLPCTPGCDPGVRAHLCHAPVARGSGSLAASVAKAAFRAKMACAGRVVPA